LHAPRGYRWQEVERAVTPAPVASVVVVVHRPSAAIRVVVVNITAMTKAATATSVPARSVASLADPFSSRAVKRGREARGRGEERGEDLPKDGEQSVNMITA